MPKPSNREKLLSEGLRVIHRHGFGASSVRDIARAAGVPQGSFTNHFTSKEAFGLEVVDLYWTKSLAMLRETLENTALRPLDRLRAYLDAQLAQFQRDGMRNGCLFGNFSAEACGHSELIRHRLVEICAARQASIASCLRDAMAAGELPGSLDADEIAGFVLSSLQGAILIAKAERSPVAIERFTRVLLSSVLR